MMNRDGQGFPPRGMGRRGAGRGMMGRGGQGFQGRGMGRPGSDMAPPPDVARPGSPMPPKDEDAVRPMPPMQRRGMGRRGRDLPEPEAVEPGQRRPGRRVD